MVTFHRSTGLIGGFLGAGYNLVKSPSPVCDIEDCCPAGPSKIAISLRLGKKLV